MTTFILNGNDRTLNIENQLIIITDLILDIEIDLGYMKKMSVTYMGGTTREIEYSKEEFLHEDLKAILMIISKLKAPIYKRV